MNKAISFLIASGSFLFAAAGIHGQGITVLSHLQRPPDGTLPVAADSSVAILFRAGHEAWGYQLDRVWVLLQPESGEVSGLSASIAVERLPPEAAMLPLGPPEQADGGRVGFDGQGTVLQAGATYWLVLTADQPLKEGAYEWSVAGPGGGAIRVDDWVDRTVKQSIDGLTWKTVGLAGSPQYALTVTPIPEPSSLALLGLGGLLLLGQRRRGKGVQRPAANPRLGVSACASVRARGKH